MLIQFLFLVVVCAEVVSSSIIIPPGMQRKNQGESCTFQWTVQGSFTNYTVSKKSPGALSANSDHTQDVARGIISLTIRNVQLQDAGNYSLSINVGTSTTTDNGALLFVYGNPQGVLNQTAGSTPAIEGSSVELTCNVSSTSLPIEYRPKLYYLWGVGDMPRFQNISSGPATLPNGDLFNGYTIQNGGRTFVIDSVQYRDRQIKCWGQEEGTSYLCCPVTHNLGLYYRPHVLSQTPPNKRFHVDVGSQVQLGLSVTTNPSITSWSWTFVNTSGIQTPLPPVDGQSDQSFVFQLTSQIYYGHYTVTLINGIGSTTETFQVLPTAPPDQPSHLKVVYATHRQILLYWNCMWFNGRQQTISVLLEEAASNIEIETRNTTVANSCYNVTLSTLFQSKIRPETSYEISIWSSNTMGSSDVTKLAAKTPKRFKLVVSSKTIAINGTQATINFNPVNGNMTHLSVMCCGESTGDCSSNDYIITNAVYRVVFSNLPDGDVYLFDFTVYGGGSYGYYLTMVKGIRVSRTGDDDEGNITAWIIATAVLAVLLVIAVLALVGSLLFFLVKRKQPRSDPPNLPTIEENKPRELPKRPLPERKPVPSVAKKPAPDDDAHEETYEIADAPTSADDRFYMPLNEKPKRAKRNQYS